MTEKYVSEKEKILKIQKKKKNPTKLRGNRQPT